LHETSDISLNRWRWMARARSTRHRTADDDSPLILPPSSRRATAPTVTCMSMRSLRGPEMRPTYDSMSALEHVHAPVGSPARPHGQGLVAPIRVKRAGKL